MSDRDRVLIRAAKVKEARLVEQLAQDPHNAELQRQLQRQRDRLAQLEGSDTAPVQADIEDGTALRGAGEIHGPPNDSIVSSSSTSLSAVTPSSVPASASDSGQPVFASAWRSTSGSASVPAVAESDETAGAAATAVTAAGRSRAMEKMIILQEVQRLADEVASTKAQIASAEERRRDAERAMDAVLVKNEHLKARLDSTEAELAELRARSHERVAQLEADLSRAQAATVEVQREKDTLVAETRMLRTHVESARVDCDRSAAQLQQLITAHEAADSECRRELDALLAELAPLHESLTRPTAAMPIADQHSPLAANLAAARAFIAALVSDSVTALEDLRQLAQAETALALSSRTGEASAAAELKQLRSELEQYIQLADALNRDLRAEQARVAALRDALHENEMEAQAQIGALLSAVQDWARGRAPSAPDAAAADAVTPISTVEAAIVALSAATPIPPSVPAAADDSSSAAAAATTAAETISSLEKRVAELEVECARLRHALSAASAAAQAAEAAAHAAEVAASEAEARERAAVAAAATAATAAGTVSPISTQHAQSGLTLSTPGPLLLPALDPTPSDSRRTELEDEVERLRAQLQDRDASILKLGTALERVTAQLETLKRRVPVVPGLAPIRPPAPPNPTAAVAVTPQHGAGAGAGAGATPSTGVTPALSAASVAAAAAGESSPSPAAAVTAAAPPLDTAAPTQAVPSAAASGAVAAASGGSGSLAQRHAGETAATVLAAHVRLREMTSALAKTDAERKRLAEIVESKTLECDRLRAEAARLRTAAKRSAAEALARKQDLEQALSILAVRRLPRTQQAQADQLLSQKSAEGDASTPPQRDEAHWRGLVRDLSAALAEKKHECERLEREVQQLQRSVAAVERPHTQQPLQQQAQPPPQQQRAGPSSESASPATELGHLRAAHLIRALDTLATRAAGAAPSAASPSTEREATATSWRQRAVSAEQRCVELTRICESLRSEVMGLTRTLEQQSPAERAAQAEQMRRSLVAAVTAALAEHEARIAKERKRAEDEAAAFRSKLAGRPQTPTHTRPTALGLAPSHSGAGDTFKFDMTQLIGLTLRSEAAREKFLRERDEELCLLKKQLAAVQDVAAAQQERMCEMDRSVAALLQQRHAQLAMVRRSAAACDQSVTEYAEMRALERVAGTSPAA